MSDRHTLLQACLDELIQLNQQSQNCFRYASRSSGDLSLKAQLAEYEQIHEAFIKELTTWASQWDMPASQRQLNALAMTLPGRSTFQYALTTGDRYAILEQCQSHLSKTIDGYQEVLRQKLPDHLLEDLLGQVKIIKKNHAAIHRMCVMALPQFPQRRPARVDKARMDKAGKVGKTVRTVPTVRQTPEIVTRKLTGPVEPMPTA